MSLPKSSRRDCGTTRSLSEQEKVRFIATFMAFLSYSQNAFLKWREGLLAPPLWMGWEQVMMNLVGAPGGKAFWKERSYHVWRGIPPIHRERSYEKGAAPRRETDGCFHHRPTHGITNWRSRQWPLRRRAWRLFRPCRRYAPCPPRSRVQLPTQDAWPCQIPLTNRALALRLRALRLD